MRIFWTLAFPRLLVLTKNFAQEESGASDWSVLTSMGRGGSCPWQLKLFLADQINQINSTLSPPLLSSPDQFPSPVPQQALPRQCQFGKDWRRRPLERLRSPPTTENLLPALLRLKSSDRRARSLSPPPPTNSNQNVPLHLWWVCYSPRKLFVK